MKITEFIKNIFIYLTSKQRSRLDKCGSCCIKPMANRVRFFGLTVGTCAHAFPLPDTPLHTKVTFRKTENQVTESRNTWFVAEHLEQILRGRVSCNVR